MKTYSGLLKNLPDNGIFLFGSNPLGINGNPIKGTGGAALFALQQGWVEQGEKMDNCLAKSGKAWGLTTVKFPGGKRSKTPDEIKSGIAKVYEYARANSDKEFYVAYTVGGARNLNGYTNEEMASFFAAHAIPDNVYFEEGFSKLFILTKDFREDWFFQQHYSKEELQQLWEWVQKSGHKVEVKEQNSKWSGFHIEDKEMTIDIAGQPSREDCCNWMIRLGFEVIN